MLARMAEVERRRFGVKYTPAGMDLLHRIGWSVQVSRGGRLSGTQNRQSSTHHMQRTLHRPLARKRRSEIVRAKDNVSDYGGA